MKLPRNNHASSSAALLAPIIGSGLYFAVMQGMLPLPGGDAGLGYVFLAAVVMFLCISAGVVLALISLARRESRMLACVALILNTALLSYWIIDRL